MRGLPGCGTHSVDHARYHGTSCYTDHYWRGGGITGQWDTHHHDNAYFRETAWSGRSVQTEWSPSSISTDRAEGRKETQVITSKELNDLTAKGMLELQDPIAKRAIHNGVAE